MHMENSRTGVILHDYFNILGGGERVVGALANYLEWPIIAGFKNSRYSKTGKGDVGYKGTKWVDQISTLNCYQGLVPLQIMSLIRGFRDRSPSHMQGCSKALYSGTYAPLGVLKSSTPVNIYYCHSPARFIYDQRDFYLSAIPFWQRPVLKWLIRKFQPLYEAALPMMDRIIANSENVRQRLLTYLGLDATVIYPPCDTTRFSWLGQSNFYLSTARLDPLKRVDLVVEAFRHMTEKQLVVVSGGADEEKIRKAADGADNIKVLGWVSEGSLKELIGTCIATIYIPKEEDFGMSPVESMSAGKPVIGVREGGLLETVGDSETPFVADFSGGDGADESFVETPYGVLVENRPTVDDVIQAVKWMDAQRALEKRGECEKRAMIFDTQNFVEKITNVVF